MSTDLVVFALLLAVYGLIAARLDRWSVGPAMAFVAIGLLASDEMLGVISFAPAAETVETPGRRRADAAPVRRRVGDQQPRPASDAVAVVRLLLIGLPLTIVLGTLGATFLFPGISFGLALLIRLGPGAHGCGPRPAGSNQSRRAGPDQTPAQRRERPQRRHRNALRIPGHRARRGGGAPATRAG